MGAKMGFEGKHVVVTGGTGALGQSVVRALSASGAICHVPQRGPVDPAKSPFNNQQNVHLTGGVDLTEAASVQTFYTGLPPLWASLHMAGGFAMAPLADTSAEDFMAQISMNALSCFLCCRAAVTAMGLGGGRIVNVAARPALEPRLGAGMVAYTASKAAVAALTQALGEELADKGILVNAVAPSIMDTPANRQAMPKADHAAWPTTDQVAAVILSLAVPENEVARGGILPVYGRS
ncbi:MAG: SDR family NAD(P)-dependent oxidoreductase [Magnetospiraceae bacterium]